MSQPLDVKLRRLPHGEGLELPAYGTPQSAGCDLRAAVTETMVIDSGRWALVPCGFAMALPAGWEAQVRPRSGLAVKRGVTVLNGPGTIDADYRGEVMVPIINHGPEPFEVARGDRIAQMVVAPVTQVAWQPVDSLDDTERGSGGFGSTGKR